MTEEDSTSSAPKALPTSTYPIVDFDCLSIQRINLFESVLIEAPPDMAANEPGNHQDESLLQVVVLGMYLGSVYLGLYAHPSLTFKKGPKPAEQWMTQWQAFAEEVRDKREAIKSPHHPSHRMPTRSSPLSEAELNGAEISIRDELDALGEAHYFSYLMMEAVFDSEEVRASMDWRLALGGFYQWRDWMLLREKRVRRLVDEEYRTNVETLKHCSLVEANLSALANALSCLETTDRNKVLDFMAANENLERSDVDKIIDKAIAE